MAGASGAGKTTLLDVLARRKTGGHIAGSIMVSDVLTTGRFTILLGNLALVQYINFSSSPLSLFNVATLHPYNQVNGEHQDERFRRLAGYVEQQDIHSVRSTVREVGYIYMFSYIYFHIYIYIIPCPVSICE